MLYLAGVGAGWVGQGLRDIPQEALAASAGVLHSAGPGTAVCLLEGTAAENLSGAGSLAGWQASVRAWAWAATAGREGLAVAAFWAHSVATWGPLPAQHCLALRGSCRAAVAHAGEALAAVDELSVAGSLLGTQAAAAAGVEAVVEHCFGGWSPCLERRVLQK